jgi:sulfate adenylyltransferase
MKEARRGFCLWLTGLSGAGKTTMAIRVRDVIAQGGTAVTLLDGDVVREHLFPGRGFSRTDRDRNVHAVAWIAGEIVRHGGLAICSLISPYRAAREEARALVGADRFVEVFVDAPLAVVEARDVKGLYARARSGDVAGMTGVDDPYEPPTNPDIRVDTVGQSVDQNVMAILAFLEARGLLDGAGGPDAVGESGGAVDPGGG